MAARLLEGRAVADRISSELKSEISALASLRGRAPKLVSVQIGENPSSAVYVKNQKKAAEALGISYELKALSPSGAAHEAEEAMAALNADASVDAVILQLPVPPGIDAVKLAGAIDPDKDAEGIKARNLGGVMRGDYAIGPCTAMAVMELLKSTGAKLYGMEAVVVGHSDIVGKPLAMMLVNAFATTTICHIATGERKALEGHVRRAEVLVVAVGKAGLIKGDWVKEGAIVIDVGINRVGDRIVGDVEFEPASRRASMITPVPGGVGPLTTVMLMKNAVELYKRRT